MMRLAIAAVLLSATTGAAFSADVPASSKVEAVTVFLSGAEVTRAAHVTLERGDHTIILNDLPASAVPGSIRVEGKATGKLDIGSVDTVRKFLQRAESQAADADRKVIEDEIERLGDERAAVESQSLAAETQKALLANLVQLPTRPAPAAATGALPEDWTRLLAQIAQGTTDAGRLQIDAQSKLRDLDRKMQDLQKKLGALVPAKTEQTEVRVYVAAASALEADLIVRYQVPNANWTPLYDARLITGAKTIAPKLELARRAGISQRSGESWDNVALVLSTARPSEGAAAPQIDTQFVGYEVLHKPEPVAPVATSEDRRRVLRSLSQKQAMDGTAGAPEADAVAQTMAPVPVDANIDEAVANVISAPFEATFAVPGQVSIAATGESKRVLLATDSLEPILSSRTVPKSDANAYLYAKFKFASGTPLLPGQVYLFRDGTFVGSGALPLLPPGIEHDLGFGIDDQVKVRHAVLEEKRGETGLISTSRVDSRSFRVTVKNLHERPIDISVFDRLPVAQNDEIKVEFTGKLTPSLQNVDEKRGVMRFDARLDPDEEWPLEYGYKISWPAAKSIIYGP